MHVGFVIHSLDPATGGVTSSVIEMASALSALGVRCTLICFDDPSCPYIASVPAVLDVCAVGPCKNSWGYVEGLPARLAKLGVNAFVLNGLWMFPSMAVARWARSQKIPYLLFPHGMLDPYFHQFFLKRIKKALYWLFIESHVFANAKAICFTTKSEELLARQSFWPYWPRRKEVVGLGFESIPADALEAAKANFRANFPALGDRPYIIYLSRFHPKKGADLLLKALADFPDLTLVMAGPVNGAQAGYVAELQKLAPAGRVLWTGLITGELKWGALAGAQALFLPSHQENFGMVVAEALSVGTPTFVSNKVATYEEVMAHQAGFVAPDTLAGTKGLLKAFTQLSPRELATLRTNAVACYEKCFRPASVATRLHKILQST